MHCGVLSFLLSGVVCAFVGSCLVGMWDPIYNHVFNDLMKLYPGSFSYNEVWHELPIPLYMEVFLWNVTNYDEILENSTTKPIMEEVGPYTFEEHHLKVNELWSPENVTYDQIKTWTFLPERSVGDPYTDEIYNINMVALGLAEWVRGNARMIQRVNRLYKILGVTPFIHGPAMNWTFDGVEDPILSFVSGAVGIAGGALPDWLVHFIQEFVPDHAIPLDAFGWFYGRNGSELYEGNYTMFSGVTGLDKLGQIIEWKGLPHVKERIYSDHCGMLNGSAGDFFPPNRNKTYVDYFSSDICRTIRFNYKEKDEVKGVPGYKYILDGDTIFNATYRPDNYCFNPRPSEEIYLPNGLLNVSSCKFNTPSYVSFPHFYQADSSLLDAYESGVDPSGRDFESTLTLEPGTGVPLNVDIRLQINSLVRPVNSWTDDLNSILDDGYRAVDIYEDFEPTLFPSIWFQTNAGLTDDYAEDMRLLVTIQKAFPGTGWALISLGIVLFVGGVVYWCKLKKNRRRNNWSEKVL